MRRALPLLVALAVTTIPGVARADDALERLMQEAAAAEFDARGIVMCTWGPDSAASTYEVSRYDGMSMVSGSGVDVMLGGGLILTRTGADWLGVEIDAWGDWSLSDRYTLSAPVAVERLGRRAREMQVLEDSTLRARVVVDAESGVPMLTEIFSGDGSSFRVAALLDLEVRPGGNPMPEARVLQTSEIDVAPSPGDLPERAAWYRRVDTYAGPEETIQAFYSDGLFSFSVFEAERGETPEAFRSATTFESGGERYRRIVTPSQIWVQWHAPDFSYVLVGDLPPDHLRAVLADLPEPGDRSFFVRVWRWLFG